VVIAGLNNTISSTGVFTTNGLEVSSDIFTNKILSPLASIDLENITDLNGVTLNDTGVTFKTINVLNNVSGNLNANTDASLSSMNTKSTNVSTSISTTKLVPSKIIVDSINADKINSSDVSDTLVSTHSISGKDYTFSGPLDITTIHSSRTLTVNNNVDIETTLFTDGDIDTLSIITCSLMTTPLFVGISNITSVEHYFDSSIINGVTFDDDGIVTSGDYSVGSIDTDKIVCSIIDKPLKINDTVDIAPTVNAASLTASKISSQTVDTGVVTGTTATFEDLTTQNITVLNPLKNGTVDILKDNKITAKTLKATSSTVTQKDVFATNLSVSGNLIYNIQVHVVTTAPTTLSGTTGSINEVKLVPGLIVLVTSQASAIENGIYVAVDGPWSRHFSMLDAVDAVKATVTDLYGKTFTNTEDPCIVGTHAITFVEYTSTVLEGTFDINKNTTLNAGNVTSNGSITLAGQVVADSVTADDIKLSYGMLTFDSPSLNGMTTTSDHLSGVTDIFTHSIVADTIDVTDLQVDRIIGKSTFGGVTFDTSNISGVNDLQATNLKSNSVQTSNITISGYVGKMNARSVSLNNGKITGDTFNLQTLNVNNLAGGLVSMAAPVGTYTLKFPDVYPSVLGFNALTRTTTDSNTWTDIPDGKSRGVGIQYQVDNSLTSTTDLLYKQTSTLKIVLSDAQQTLKNTKHLFVDGTYSYSNAGLEFDVVVTSSVPTIENVSIPPGGVIYNVQVEIPTSNSTLKTTKVKVNDTVISGSKIQTATGNVAIQTTDNLNIVSAIKKGNVTIGNNSKFNSITNGTVSILSNGNFTGISEPTISTHPVTKDYTDSNLQVFKWTDSVDYVHNQNVTTYNTSTFTNINVIFIDGINISTLSDGVTILLIGQTDKTENGVYVLTNGKTGLTRTLTGQVAGTSTHVKKGVSNTDAVYVCTGTSVTAGTDPCIYTQVIDGRYSFASGIINNGTVAINTGDFRIVDEQIAITDPISFTKLSSTGFGIKDSTGSYVVTLGNATPTAISISNNKSLLDVNESYFGTKTFNSVISNGDVVVTNSVNVSGNVLSQTLPFLTGTTLVTNNVDIAGDVSATEIIASNIQSTNIVTPSLQSFAGIDVDNTKIAFNNMVADSIVTDKAVFKNPTIVNVDALVTGNVVQSGTGTYTLDSTVLLISQTNSLENGVYIVKTGSWVKLSFKFASSNGTVFQLSSQTGIVTPFVKKSYDITNVSSIGNTYTADYYSVKPIHLITSYVDNVKVSVGETVLVVDDGIYTVSVNNWLRSAFFQENETCTIQKGDKYSQKQFKIVNGETILNYDYIVEVAYYTNVSLLANDKPVGTNVLLTGQTIQSENGIYTVSESLTLVFIGAISGIKTVISLEDFTVFTTQGGVTFYVSPKEAVDYFNPPQSPIQSDTYTDGTSIYVYNNRTFEKVRDLSSNEYIYVSNIQKVFHGGEFILELSKPTTSVTTGGITFVNNTLSGVNSLVSSVPESDIAITRINGIGTKLLTSVDLKSQAVEIQDATLVTKATTTVVNDIISDDLNLRSTVSTIQGDIDFSAASELLINSDTTFMSSKIKQKGTKVVYTIEIASIPSGISGYPVKHGDLVLLLNTFGVYRVDKSGPWIKVITAEEPFIFGQTQYNTDISLSMLTSSPYLEGNVRTDLYTKDINISQDLNITSDAETSEINTGTFSLDDTLDIYQDTGVISIGKKYVYVDTHYTADLVITNLDPLENAIDTGLRGKLNGVQLYPGAKVLLINQTNSADDGVYIVNYDQPASKIANPENHPFKDINNKKYFDHTFVEVFPVENTVININTNTIDTPIYITETKIESLSQTTSGLFQNVSSSVTMGSSSAVINLQSESTAISGHVEASIISTSNMSTKNLISPDITITGNITSLNEMKFDTTISLNSVDLTSVNDLLVNKGIECDSMVTPEIRHSGALDIHSIVADTVIENATITNKRAITVPEFNNYEFDGLFAYGNISKTFATLPVLEGIHSNLSDGDLVIVAEPLSTSLTTHAVTIENAKGINELTVPNATKITSVTTTTSGYTCYFNQISDTVVDVYIINSSNSAHGFENNFKMPINTTIDVEISGYNYPITNGVYSVDSGSWDRISATETKAVTLELKYFYKTFNKPHLIPIPYRIRTLPRVISSTTNSTIASVSDNAMVVDVSNTYTDSFTKVDSSGTFNLIDENTNAVVNNLFIHPNENAMYVQNGFEVKKHTWLRVNYVVEQNVAFPTLVNPQPVWVGTNKLLASETILLTNQTNTKENGLYILVNNLLIRQTGFSEQNLMDRFIWGSNAGYGYYVYGIIGNFLIIQKTTTSHPHASEKIVLSKIITNEINCPLPSVKVFQDASNMTLEIENINSKKFVNTKSIITTPTLLMSGSMVSNGDTVVTTGSILINQNIKSASNLNISSKSDVVIGSLSVTPLEIVGSSLITDVLNVKIVETSAIQSTGDIDMADFTFNGIVLSDDTLAVVLDVVPIVITDTINTTNLTTESIDTDGAIVFVDENVVAMKIVDSTVDIPRMTLPKIASGVVGPTITSVFSDATADINAFTKASEINLDTVEKTIGNNSYVKINGSTRLRANNVTINQPMINNTQKFEMYGDLNVSNITATKNLTFINDIVLGQDFFTISSQLNKINFTTDLPLDSFLGNATGVSIGNRNITNKLSIKSNQNVLSATEINLNYLKGVPTFNWQTNVDVICEYPIDLQNQVVLINGKTVVPGMTVLLTKNEYANGTYLVNSENKLTLVDTLKLTNAYTETSSGRSFYVNNGGSDLSNEIPVIVASSVPFYSNDSTLQNFDTHTTTSVSGAAKINITFKVRFNKITTGTHCIYFNNGNQVYVDNLKFVVSFASGKNKSQVIIPGGLKVDTEYTVEATFNITFLTTSIQLNGVVGTDDITNVFVRATDLIVPFEDTYIVGYNTAESKNTLLNAEITDFNVSIPDTAAVSTNTNFLIKDQKLDRSGLSAGTLNLNINYGDNTLVVYECDVIFTSTEPNVTPVIFNCNGNKVYANHTVTGDYVVAIYADTLIEGTGYFTRHHVPITVFLNTKYSIKFTINYTTNESVLVVNNIQGSYYTNKPTSFNTYINRLKGVTQLGSISHGNVSNFQISTPGYAPTIPKVTNITDLLVTKGSYIHTSGSTSSHIVSVDTTLLDNRSVITLDLDRYLIYPYITVIDNKTFKVIPYGSDGAAVSITAPINYTISNFDYSRTDTVTLANDKTMSTFTFTSTEYAFDQKLEFVSFKFKGVPGFAFSGELLDSYSSVRKPGYSNYNTWMITVKRTNLTNTSSLNLKLKYVFVVSKYPYTQVQNIVKLPSKNLKYISSIGQYKQRTYAGTDHTSTTYSISEQKPLFGTNNVEYINLQVQDGTVLINNISTTFATIKSTPIFTLTRIPNIYNLKPGVYNTTHASDQNGDVTRKTLTPVIPNNIYNDGSNNVYFSNSHIFPPTEGISNVTVSHSEKYRIVPVISYPNIAGVNKNTTVYFVYVDINGDVITTGAPAMHNFIQFEYTSTTNLSNANEHSSTIQVYEDFVFIVMDKSTKVSSINIPIMNQPEYSFTSDILTIAPKGNNISLTDYNNINMDNVSILRTNVFGFEIYKIPNVSDYTPGIYFDYKMNGSQASKRTEIVTVSRTMSQVYGGNYTTLTLKNGSILENISVSTPEVQTKYIFIPLVDANQITLFAFAEDGTVSTSNLAVDISMQVSTIIVNFYVTEISSTLGTFEFEIPNDVPNGSVAHWDYKTITIPGGNVIRSSLSVNNNIVSGNVTKIGPNFLQGTFYNSFSLPEKWRETSVNVTPEYIYVSKHSLYKPVSVPIFKTTNLSQSDTQVVSITQTNVVTPELDDNNILLFPPANAVPLNNAELNGYTLAYITNTYESELVMSMRSGNVIIKPNDPVGYKRTIKVNDDIVSGGLYDLSFDKNTEKLAFVPQRTYTNFGSSDVLFGYKVEINSNNELVVEKKPLNKQTVSAADNESFGLSVYKVKKPAVVDPIRLYISGDKGIVNIPQKKHNGSKSPNFITYVTINMGFNENQTIVKTPIPFHKHTVVKFENIPNVVFSCTKISSDIFAIKATTATVLATKLTFQVLFLETETPISNESTVIKSVSSISPNFTNNSSNLTTFISENANTYASVNTVPYPATATTDRFNTQFPTTPPVVTSSGVKVDDSTTTLKTALKTVLTNELTYTFRIHAPSSNASKTITVSANLNSIAYPVLTNNSASFDFYAEYVGPLIDNSYTFKNETNYASQVSIQNGSLNLKLSRTDGTPWSNITYWNVTVYRKRNDYSDHITTSTFD
jgi:hypothetical protein